MRAEGQTASRSRVERLMHHHRCQRRPSPASHAGSSETRAVRLYRRILQSPAAPFLPPSDISPRNRQSAKPLNPVNLRKHVCLKARDDVVVIAGGPAILLIFAPFTRDDFEGVLGRQAGGALLRQPRFSSPRGSPTRGRCAWIAGWGYFRGYHDNEIYISFIISNGWRGNSMPPLAPNTNPQPFKDIQKSSQNKIDSAYGCPKSSTGIR